MSTALIQLTPEAQELIAFASTFLGTAQAVKITTPEEAQAAVDQTRAIKDCAKTIEEVRKSFTVPLDEQKKAYMDVFRPAVEVLEKSESLLKSAILAFQQEERRKAQEAEAERRRLQAEEDARLRKEQEDAQALLKQADEAAAAGDITKAEELEERAQAIQTATVYVPVTPIAAPVKPKGAATKQVWKCRVVDPALVPAEYKVINEKALDAYAKAMKENAKLPGCEFFAEDNLAIR